MFVFDKVVNAWCKSDLGCLAIIPIVESGKINENCKIQYVYEVEVFCFAV